MTSTAAERGQNEAAGDAALRMERLTDVQEGETLNPPWKDKRSTAERVSAVRGY